MESFHCVDPTLRLFGISMDDTWCHHTWRCLTTRYVYVYCAVYYQKASEVINPLVSKQFVNCVLIWLLKMLTPSLVWCAKRKIRLMMTPLQRAGTKNDRINDRNHTWVLVVIALGWELTGTGLWFSW